MSHPLVSRTAAATLLSLLFLSGSASVASACPNPGDIGPTAAFSEGHACPLERIGTQLVRCDNLTGAGVPAPLFIPEQMPYR